MSRLIAAAMLSFLLLSAEEAADGVFRRRNARRGPAPGSGPGLRAGGAGASLLWSDTKTARVRVGLLAFRASGKFVSHRNKDLTFPDIP